MNGSTYKGDDDKYDCLKIKNLLIYIKENIMKKLIFIYIIITVIQIYLLMIYIGIKLDNISDNISSNIESSIDKNTDEKVKIEIYQDGNMLKSLQID